MKNENTKQLKILQFCDNFYPQIDGVVKVVDNSTKIMNERASAKVVVPKYKGKVFDDSIFSYEVLRRKTSSITFNGIEIPLPKKTDDLTCYRRRFIIQKKRNLRILCKKLFCRERHFP